MHLFRVAALVAAAMSTFAERLPEDHIAWGRMGKPMSLVKRQAIPTASSPVVATPTSADEACSNGAFTRACWGNGYSISTDFDLKWPTTGKTRIYNFEITNTTCNPDGNVARTCLLINNQYPGPTIFADWGDTIQVNLKNSMQSNGTGLHFHGIRQLGTTTEDGANGLTECPLAPGDSKTYTFQATQYGSTWYHAHYSLQYGDGVLGTIQINGPATANYDIDLGTYPITDWFYSTAFQFGARANASQQHGQGPPPGDTILINGTNKNPAGGGKYSQVSLVKGKKHRLRLISTAVEAAIRVSLDGHSFTVISSDLVPIKPYTTNWVLLAVGQRYDVIITANQASGNFWFRAEVASDCASSVKTPGRAVFTYSGTTVADPTTTGANITAVCKDESPLVPWWPTTVPSADFVNQAKSFDVDLTVQNVTTNGQNLVVWSVNLTAIDVDWEKPTLQYVMDKNTNYPKTDNLIELPNENIWTYWIIQETPGSPVPIPHPIHLHGHDFFVLGTGSGVFNMSTSISSLNFNNPRRRDVTFLPGAGWVVVAFLTDNPGSWLMHCHISSHISAGLGVQFLEAKDQIKQPSAAWKQTCANWNTYYNYKALYHQDDSGL